ncbi:MAG: hypothetical protein JW789_02525 [Candidatus Aenigmarchaeota archaeon]|nr:hypothetical protein [Candidatus Aenigmarchaeota archaeon]
MFFNKLKLMKECFPESWLRKLPLLFFKADTIEVKGEIASMCITKGDRIILLCTGKKHRRKGYAGKLIRRSKATQTYTYEGNKAGLNAWIKNGFRLVNTVDSPFGRRHILIRKASSGSRKPPSSS